MLLVVLALSLSRETFMLSQNVSFTVFPNFFNSHGTVQCANIFIWKNKRFFFCLICKQQQLNFFRCDYFLFLYTHPTMLKRKIIHDCDVISVCKRVWKVLCSESKDFRGMWDSLVTDSRSCRCCSLDNLFQLFVSL